MARTTTASQTLSVTLTGITGEELEFPTRRNVKKRIADIKYLASLPTDAVSLAYAGSEEISADKNLFIGDRSDRLYLNAKNKEDSEFTFTSTSSGVSHRNVLVTQKFAMSQISEIPLYFKHVLSSDIDIDSIKIFNKDFNEVSMEDHYLIERTVEYSETTGVPISPVSYLDTHVYNSLESNFDSSTGDYEVYYIQYIDSSNVLYTVLLDNEPAYRDALPEDIWHLTLSLAPWAIAYFIEVSGGSYLLRVPSAGVKTAVRYTSISRIHADSPASSSSDSLWFPRISNGSFSASYGGRGYTYEVAEFENQAFNPISPYKIASRLACQKVSSSLIKTPHLEIENGGFYEYLSIVISSEDEVIYALTEDSSKVGSRYKDFGSKDVQKADGTYVLWSSTEILSIDKYGGFVHLSLGVQDHWEINATYSYKENYYEMSNLNMNPIFDSTVHSQIRILYLVPRSIANSNLSQTASLKYLKINTAGTIEETTQDGNDGNENISYTTILGDAGASSIDGALGLHYSWRASTYLAADSTIGSGETVYVDSTTNFPPSGWVRIEDNSSIWRYVKYESKTETSLILSTDTGFSVPTVPISLTFSSSSLANIQIVNFVDERTISSSRDVNIENTKYDTVYVTQPSCVSRYLILAEMTVNPNHSIDKVVLLDTREEGGGIEEEQYDDAKAIQPEVQWFYDYLKFDGQPTPGNAAVVIKLPSILLDTFTKDQIEEIIDESIPYGIKPLVRFYEYFPLITSALPVNDSTIAVTIDDFNIPYAFILNNSNDGNVRVAWDKMGSEFVYYIWYAFSEDGPWTKHNKIRVIDSVYDENTYVLTGLAEGVQVYVKVTCVDKYDSWWCSYSSYNSVEGGYGHDEDAPTFPFGNIAGFQAEVL